MPHKRRLIFHVACLTTIAFCVVPFLQWAGVVPPLGVGWGDATRGRAYSVEVRWAIILRTAAGMKAAPPGGYAYGVQTLSRSDGVGLSYHRWNMTAGRTPQAPVLGTFAEVQISPAWPLLIALIVASLWVMQIVKQRQAMRASGHCPTCGYDLRATPNRCPECGAIRAE